MTSPTLFQRLKKGLSRTHQSLVGRVEQLLGTAAVTPEAADDFLEVLISADIGADTASTIVDLVKERIRKGELRQTGDLLDTIKGQLLQGLTTVEGSIEPGAERPWVVMVAGINGSGKTTTIAKLGHRWTVAGRKVSFAAADTFRAGAVEQLRIWADRVGAEFHSGSYGADPSSIVWDAVGAATARGRDILLIDTAGRLHTSANLMEELKKVHRTCGRVMPGSPHEVLLVLDASNGQNALLQARQFHQAVGVTGIALTKLDGTAKGGIIVAIARELGLPVKLVGVGEEQDDLQDFHAGDFVEALFSS